MTLRRFATVAALAIAGLAAAVGIGLLANSISGDSVGLGAEPLSAGDTLVPASAKADEDEKPQQRPRHRKRHRKRATETSGDSTATLPADSVAVPPSTGTGGTVTTFDDHGGETSGSDDGGTSGSSGSSGSGSSGSGSDDLSGSSGSGSSGSSSHSGGSDD